VSLSEAIISSPGISIIAEFKTTYPSSPPLHISPDPVRVAETYSAAKVAGVSVLVERDFFGGDPELFSILRSRLSLPMLFKDFVATEKQIELAKRLGADAVLLIAKALRPEVLDALIGACLARGMEPLVELHDIVDLEKLSSCGREDSVRLVGINRRNLRTLEVSKGELGELRRLVGVDKIVIAESGVECPRDILALRGFDAVLIGSMFMQAEDLEKTVKEAVSMGRSVRR
jgi:indole-3-glycerol phosphate synthase